MSPGQDRSSPWSAACGVGESLLGLGNSVMWPRATNCYTPHTRTYTPHTHARRWMHAGKPPLRANDRHRHRHRHRQQAPSTNQANTRTHTHTHTHTPSTGKLKNKYVQYLKPPRSIAASPPIPTWRASALKVHSMNPMLRSARLSLFLLLLYTLYPQPPSPPPPRQHPPIPSFTF